MAQAYSVSGRQTPPAFIIPQETDALQRAGSADVREDKVFFAWQDNRTPGNGYDIYGTIMPLSIITSTQDNNNQKAISNKYMLYSGYPNPANPSTTLQYTVPKTSHVLLQIYDILGRKVRTLVDDRSYPGLHEVTWDGKDDSGNSMPTGIYLCRMNTPHSVHSIKIALIR